MHAHTHMDSQIMHISYKKETVPFLSMRCILREDFLILSFLSQAKCVKIPAGALRTPLLTEAEKLSHGALALKGWILWLILEWQRLTNVGKSSAMR